MTEKLITRPWINSSTLVLLLRLVLGVVFFAHGAQKFLGWFGGYGITTTLGFFQKMGIPAILGYAAIFAEFCGSLLLIAGIFTRPAALAIMVNMLVAIFLVHFSKGFFNPAGYEYPFTLLIAALGILLFGPGQYSVDSFLFVRTRVDRKGWQEKKAA